MTKERQREREVHLVGSVPAGSAGVAIRWALQELGNRLRTVPDGETGDRYSWIMSQEPRIANSHAFVVKRAGTWSSYMDIPRYAVAPGHKLTGTSLDLQYAHHAIMGRWTLDETLKEAGLPDRPLLVGIPSPVDLAVFMLGLPAGLRHRGAFIDATASEVHEARAETKSRAVYQLEMPLETVMAIKAAKLPALARRQLHRKLIKDVIRLVKQTPMGTPWIIHLCLGDLRNTPVARAESTQPMVELIDALIDAWPHAENTLVAVHLPLCDGQLPPSLDPAFYRPLCQLRGIGITYHAGFAHLRSTIEDQRQVQGFIEEALDGYAGVASPCGLGRMDMERASRLAMRYRELAAIA